MSKSLIKVAGVRLLAGNIQCNNVDSELCLLLCYDHTTNKVPFVYATNIAFNQHQYCEKVNCTTLNLLFKAIWVLFVNCNRN